MSTGFPIAAALGTQVRLWGLAAFAAVPWSRSRNEVHGLGDRRAGDAPDFSRTRVGQQPDMGAARRRCWTRRTGLCVGVRGHGRLFPRVSPAAEASASLRDDLAWRHAQPGGQVIVPLDQYLGVPFSLGNDESLSSCLAYCRFGLAGSCHSSGNKNVTKPREYSGSSTGNGRLKP